MKKKLFSVVVAFLCLNCIDEVDIGISSVESNQGILIVEGTLTNEFKTHKIVLSRMDTLVDLGIDPVIIPFLPIRDINRDLVPYERNATVSVTDEFGAKFDFEETSPGIYQSRNQFAAEMGNSYQLKIIRANGLSYSSKQMKLEGVSTIENIYAEKTISDSGANGIGIFIDNRIQEGDVENLRFIYHETYKIIAPDWSPQEFLLTDYDPCALPVPTYNLEIIERQEEERICYATKPSDVILQTQISNQEDNDIKKLKVRFLSKDNFIISHRYSIEVTQMVTGSESYGFYNQLNNFSQTGNIFSQVQPGFLEGNLFADNGSTGTVIGFFDLVTASKKRLFFNFSDFYPNEPLPPYIINCSETTSPESHISYCSSGPSIPQPCPQSVIERVNLDVISYVRPNEETGQCDGPHIYVANICGDCTLLGSNTIPDFWIEE